MAKRKSLDDLIEEAGYSEESARHVKLSIESLGHEAKIMTGELVLPHPVDAHKHMLRETGQWGKSEEHQKLESAHAALADEVAALRQAVAALTPKGGD